MSKAIKALMLIACLQSSATLRADSNFQPSIYNGSLCFTPQEARELLNAYKLVPLLENKISDLYKIQDDNDSLIVWYQNEEARLKTESRKKRIKAGFIGAGVGATIQTIFFIIIKIAL